MSQSHSSFQHKTSRLCTTFHTNDHYYIYTAWTNQIARISERLYRLFSTSTPEDNACTGIELGLLPETNIPLEIFRQDRREEVLVELDQKGPEILILSLTEQCNFRCRYCQFSGAYHNSRIHSAKQMTVKTALQSVDWCAGFTRDKRHIGFYGGEPLLQFDLMQKVVDHAKAILEGDVSFGLTTNGALLTPEISDFLVENDFHLFVSLDGPKEIHDRYRVDSRGNPTFEVIWHNLQMLRKRHPNYYQDHLGFNITAAPPDALPRVRDFINNHQNMLSNKIIKISSLKQDPSDVLQSLAMEENDAKIEHDWIWEDFLDACITGERPPDLTRSLCEPAMARIHHRVMEKVNVIRTDAGQCEPGRRCHVSPDGEFHMCEHIDNHLSIGSVDSGYNREAITRYLDSFGKLMEEFCHDCWAIRLCSRCIPHLADGPRLSRDRLASLCARNKQGLKRNLVRYCTARDANPNCFDWISGKKYDINL